MLARFKAISAIARGSLYRKEEVFDFKVSSEHFGSHVFNRDVMQKMLPRDIYLNVVNAQEGLEKIKPQFADTIAVAMKEWAISLGATHFTHWFQPLTGASAEKHDSFIEWTASDRMIEKFTGKQLIQGEPDASSFPSGGLRSTYEARGYTAWDPTSCVFVWKAGNSNTLYIPSIFFSWTGDVLDSKIPLHRSEKKLSDQVLRLLRFTGGHAGRAFAAVGLEQEYFVIDRFLRDLRPDLVMAGRTLFGASSAKGQQLQDHYFGSVKERILSFMDDFERAALKLGIPVKTRHNEVAPAQYEVAPVVERASLAIDHNIQLMELMRKIALKHNLASLLHEKPFADINGSGKHCNWSIITDNGLNLLDPSDAPEDNLSFLILLTAILWAVHEYAELLRASIGSLGNDARLGGHEAPPAIISVYLGGAIENMLDDIEKHGFHKRSSKKSGYDLGILELPDLTRDYTDRNRTSPFAFTGNKFEFRALGSSQNASLPVTILNAATADGLKLILDEIEKRLTSRNNLIEAIVPVVRKYLKISRKIRFSGDNYSSGWLKEAEARKLPNIRKSIDAAKVFLSAKTGRVFKGILTEQELYGRYNIFVEHYCHRVNIELKAMMEMFKTMVLPAALEQEKVLAEALIGCKELGVKNQSEQKSLLSQLSSLMEEGLKIGRDMEEKQKKANELPIEKRALQLSRTLLPMQEDLRRIVDEIEGLVDDDRWPLPKYRELLFLI